MKLKIYKIINFSSFFEKVKNQKLPFKTSYQLTLLDQEIEKHTNFYQEKFRELIMEYGKKDSDGGLVPTADGQGIQLMEDKIQEANERIQELQSLDVELPDIKFSPNDFNNISLSPLEMKAILPFIEE